MPESLPLLMDRAYEGNQTRQLVLDLGMIPVVPPKSNRLHPWDYDRALYKKRNEIERLFRRLKTAYRLHPERLVRQRPSPHLLPKEVWINKPLNSEEKLVK
jgi:transposase